MTAGVKARLQALYRRLVMRGSRIEESREELGTDAFLSNFGDSWYFHGGLRRPVKRRRD